jgi:hypothetical protein
VPTVSVTLADYAMSRIVVEEALRRTLFRLPPNTQRITEAVLRLHRKDRRGVTYLDLVHETGMSYGVVYKWARPAREQGYIKYQQGTLKGNLKRLLPGDEVQGEERLLPLAKEILKLHPELGPCQFVHPITGKVVRLKPAKAGR